MLSGVNNYTHSFTHCIDTEIQQRTPFEHTYWHDKTSEHIVV